MKKHTLRNNIIIDKRRRGYRMNKIIKTAIYALYMSIIIALFLCILKELSLIAVEIILNIFYYLMRYA